MDVKNIDELEVYYEGKLVGFLNELSNGNSSFIYANSWIANGFSISPFKLPLRKQEFICNNYLVKYMFGVFYDCLPDSWGNFLVDKYLKSLQINPSNISILQRLSLLDSSSLGALSFKPHLQITQKYSKKNTDYDVIHNKIKKLLKKDQPLNEDYLDIYHKGSSTGGSRPKVNMLINGEEYIVKFPGQYDDKDIGLEEYNLNELAVQCGLNVNEHILLKSDLCKGYFAAKRFDRNENKKIHIVSLAGLFDLETNLSQIHYLGFLQTVKILCPEDLDEAIGRMIFNYLVGNKDDHPRNFSFMYVEKEAKYRLTPFFDITSTPQIDVHMMQVNGKDNPTLEDFISDCKKVNVSKTKVISIYNRINSIIKNSDFANFSDFS